MTEGSETWELDSNGKVVDICGTREVLYFNFAFKYNVNPTNECTMYKNEANLYNANLSEEKNRFNSWNFRDIIITPNDFLNLDKNTLAAERGENGELPETTFMKLDPSGPNYDVLRSIETKMENYELLSDGIIIDKRTGKDVLRNDNDEKNNDGNHNSKSNNNINISKGVNEGNINDDNEENKGSALSIGGIVAIIFGVLFIAGGIVLYFFLRKRCNKVKEEEEELETELKITK